MLLCSLTDGEHSIISEQWSWWAAAPNVAGTRDILAAGARVCRVARTGGLIGCCGHRDQAPLVSSSLLPHVAKWCTYRGNFPACVSQKAKSVLMQRLIRYAIRVQIFFPCIVGKPHLYRLILILMPYCCQGRAGVRASVDRKFTVGEYCVLRDTSFCDCQESMKETKWGNVDMSRF